MKALKARGAEEVEIDYIDGENSELFRAAGITPGSPTSHPMGPSAQYASLVKLALISVMPSIKTAAVLSVQTLRSSTSPMLVENVSVKVATKPGGAVTVPGRPVSA